MLVHKVCICLLVVCFFLPQYCAKAADTKALSDQEIVRLLTERDQLIAELFVSLTTEQRAKAEPTPAWYRDESGPESGGLGMSDFTTNQGERLLRACQISATLGGRGIVVDPSVCRFFAWDDPVSHVAKGYMHYGRGGLLLGAEELDPQQGNAIHAAAVKLVSLLWESLTDEQKKQAQSQSEDVWKGGLPYSQLNLRQRELFLAAMDLDLGRSGEHRSHISDSTEKWHIIRAKGSEAVSLMLWCIGHGFDVEAK